MQAAISSQHPTLIIGLGWVPEGEKLIEFEEVADAFFDPDTR
jgi:hypothetical protein